jgi:hypothetical protein
MLEALHSHLTSINLTGVEESIITFLMTIHKRTMNRLMYTKVRSAVHLNDFGFEASCFKHTTLIVTCKVTILFTQINQLRQKKKKRKVIYPYVNGCS